MKIFIYMGMALGLAAAPPSITELQPRGAQKGRPFTLTIAGQNLGEGARIVSAMPATFTPMAPPTGMAEGRYATFLVEPKGDLEVGVYPLRVQSGDGLSNILLFSVGAFPEINEEESQPGGVAHSNDSIEKAQSLPTSSITLNGTLRGAERDVYRLQVKAGERRVFEVDARRAGSAIDPVIRVMDGNGKQIARSEDAPLLNLDPRLDMTFPAAGYYYVEIHDARFSGQAQNFYRLKTGAYAYPTEVFPLGGQRGKQVEPGTPRILAPQALARTACRWGVLHLHAGLAQMVGERTLRGGIDIEGDVIQALGAALHHHDLLIFSAGAAQHKRLAAHLALQAEGGVELPRHLDIRHFEADAVEAENLRRAHGITAMALISMR